MLRRIQNHCSHSRLFGCTLTKTFSREKVEGIRRLSEVGNQITLLQDQNLINVVVLFPCIQVKVKVFESNQSEINSI